MKMVKCNNCQSLWPVPVLSKCENCNETDRLEKVDIPSSLEILFDKYRDADEKILLAHIGPARTTDVYPLILKELSLKLKGEIEFVLYGSAGLWLENKPRPDKTEFQTIKDLDMCAFAQLGIDPTFEQLKKLIKDTIVGKLIDWDNPGCVFKSNGDTAEFMSLDHLIQFSFALKKNQNDFFEIAKLSKPVFLPVRGVVPLPCAGLKFISAGLLSENGLFRTTLFRSDKTEKLLIYACLCIGYQTVRPDEIMLCLTEHLAGADWSNKKAFLTNVSVDRNTKTQAKYFGQTKDLTGKLEVVKKFRTKQDETTYNKVIESDLTAVLEYVSKNALSKEKREELVKKRMQEALEKINLENVTKPSTLELNQLMIKIQQQVSLEIDAPSMKMIRELTIEDATLIWESEVGTGMLIFLTEELWKVRTIISDCKWISSDHQRIILEGHGMFLSSILLELDNRLERSGMNSVTPKIEPVTKLVGQSP